ncbi:MAG: molybdopterin-dependent oxidoreductase [Chloroflexota bacterium]
MPYPWANTLLLFFILAQLASGFFGLINGQVERAWLLWAHGIGAYGLALLLSWKTVVIARSLRRRRQALVRLVYLFLLALLLLVLATGVLWTFGGRRFVFQFSLITAHVILALTLVSPLAYHATRMRFVWRLRGADDRRALLRLGGIALGGLGLWRLSAWGRQRFDLPGARRRFTGSYETGSYSGRFPNVIWLADNHPPVDVDAWSLTIAGEVERPLTLNYEQLRALAGEQRNAIVDCTGGWYSAQVWQGVGLGKLLDLAVLKPGARSVSCAAGSGYGRRFALAPARGYLLALGVAGQTLDHAHGFPLRLVAPERRGFEWVKWLARIEVHADSELLQPPVPLQ